MLKVFNGSDQQLGARKIALPTPGRDLHEAGTGKVRARARAAQLQAQETTFKPVAYSSGLKGFAHVQSKAGKVHTASTLAKASGGALRAGSVTERTARNLSNFSIIEGQNLRVGSKQKQNNASLSIKNPLQSARSGAGFSTQEYSSVPAQTISRTSKVINTPAEFMDTSVSKRVSRNTFLRTNNSVETR